MFVYPSVDGHGHCNCQEHGGHGHCCISIFEGPVFRSFGCVPKSGIVGSYKDSEFSTCSSTLVIFCFLSLCFLNYIPHSRCEVLSLWGVTHSTQCCVWYQEPLRRMGEVLCLVISSSLDSEVVCSLCTIMMSSKKQSKNHTQRFIHPPV